ncbi:TRAP transporter small permease [Szabonella alba]|uniref:TRAP transporter small permease protein n=1 Tax=Szabonella alba TaxID=2804194 RepID=A0A8K0VCH3_9RHOB|nr:TRAP transporter small permease [Szabonella alba]MBL4918501.1 TRAP transporter small permease [Szabonella alba]
MVLRRWLLASVENLLVAGFAVMIAMVFGNVVLRYGFGSGITISEEVSRMIFVWLTFGGAFLVARENGHLGVQALVNKMPPLGRLVSRVTVELASLFCMGLLITGCWAQAGLNMANPAPVSGIPLGVTYLAGIACGLGIAGLNLQRLFLLLTGRWVEPEPDLPLPAPPPAPNLGPAQNPDRRPDL